MKYCLLLLLFLLPMYSAAEPVFRDPTQPLVLPDKTSEKTQGPLALQAIFISSNRRIAIINDELLKIGDEIQAQRLIAIESNFVILDNAGEKVVLYLVMQPVKKPLNVTNEGNNQ